MLEAATAAPPPPLLTRLLSASDSEWGARWRALSSVQLSGPTRSFLWRLSHRRLHLLSAQWFASHHQSDPIRLLCNLNQRETYSHLFSDCPAAKRLWDFIPPLQDRLHADPEGDQRPARLLGDITSFSTHWRLTAEWNEEAPPPQ